MLTQKNRPRWHMSLKHLRRPYWNGKNHLHSGLRFLQRARLNFSCFLWQLCRLWSYNKILWSRESDKNPTCASYFVYIVLWDTDGKFLMVWYRWPSKKIRRCQKNGNQSHDNTIQPSCSFAGKYFSVQGGFYDFYVSIECYQCYREYRCRCQNMWCWSYYLTPNLTEFPGTRGQTRYPEWHTCHRHGDVSQC